MGWRQLALAILTEHDAVEKCRRALAFSFNDHADNDKLSPPDRPGRPAKPLLILPRDAPKRGFGTVAGRVALLHALAHIELNAVDLAFDMALRFAGEADASGLDAHEFVGEWSSIGRDEARHFLMLEARLHVFGSHYGAHPAHDGLWEAAEATADSLLARLTVAPLVLEARGLDVTPGLAERLARAGDPGSAAILQTIYAEEIGHVAAGVRWFDRLCRARGLDPQETFSSMVAKRFRGRLKPPFNDAGRAAAGMPKAFYESWTDPCVA
ncbi:MAG: ferritin-like domain-containing protein [Parvularculaceae bacterium]|nr:ferritin-like domain-containing protein [Parvularculaceae bacterium]